MPTTDSLYSDRGYSTAATPTADLTHPHRRSPVESDSLRGSGDPDLCNGAPPRRNSAFLEVGLGGDDAIIDSKLKRDPRPKSQIHISRKVDIDEAETVESSPTSPVENLPRPQMSSYFPTLPRLLFLALVIVVVAPSLRSSPLLTAKANPLGRDTRSSGSIESLQEVKREALPQKSKREDTQTDVCKRWAGQSAIVNGTLYYYGGRVTTSPDQTTDQWNLTKSWQISSPSLTGLPIPSGPPAVSLGYLWSSYDALYLYGGEFSDTPVASPVPFSTWIYDISSSSWSESSDPQTSSGKNSEPANQPVQRAAEGAGVSVPSLGRGFYFGGHLDFLTTPGWSVSVARVYLRGLLEYTFPGYSNSAVNGGKAAGSSGIYRNITDGGTQDSAGFPERADGLLVHVPGFGKSGIILGLAGGTNSTFTQMNVIDVYDIDSSTWYKQATSGPTPDIRVNPCAVAVSAADGSSTQVYMYGGQNLLPYGEQKQYDDMWILTIPAFTWIEVDTANQANPPGRAGHMCHVWNAQMVVVGGYVGQDLSCDSPGVYVFNTSSLEWQSSYAALKTDDDLNRQKSQQDDPLALQGSFGYSVPDKVQSVIGGNGVGAATVTAPAQAATQGPLATGGPITYTVTQSDGSVATETATPTGTDGSAPSVQPGNQDSGSSGGSNVGAIVAGVIAGLLAVVAAYLGFCVWLYRKQLAVYKNHVAMAQNQHLTGDPRFIGVGAAASRPYTDKSQPSSDGSRYSADNRSGSSGGRANQLSSNNPYRNVPGGTGAATAASSTEDLMAGQEPSFLGVVLNPRRSLRVVNRD
ncbi:kelch repeat protein [Cladophialophora carrionii]|uniref:Kelch repeat protein n=1 Tax=Cladophialophora carrionii TaxID=86049 RepID=A0A1C1C668_9EURO|nr:kelch repeat protein [Cladophialophora carrionii]